MADKPESESTFVEWLEKHRGGALNDRLTADFHDLAERVHLEGKNGTLTIKLTLSEESGGIIVADEVKRVDPKVNTGAFYHLWPGGALSRIHPNQPQIPGTTDKEMNHG